MRLQKFNQIVVLSLVVSMMMGCTDNGKVQKANDREAEASRREAAAAAAVSKATEMQKSYEQQLASAKILAVTNQKDADDLAAQIADFKSKQTERENSLLALQKQIESETKTVSSLKEQQVRISAEIEEGQKKIESERAALAEEKSKVTEEINQLKSKTQSEIAKLKADADKKVGEQRAKAQQEIATKEAAFQQKASQLEQKIAQADDRSKTLDVQEEKLKKQKSEQEEKASSLAQLEKSLSERQDDFRQAIQTTKEFFVKNSVGDIFENVDAKKSFVFLVNVIGYGSSANAQYVRSKVDSLQSSTSRYRDLRKLTKLQAGAGEVNAMKDSILVETKAQNMKAIRDEVDAYLQDKNAKGEQARLNSMWLVIRPVEKVRVGMKLQVHGSLDKYFDGRESQVVATFENIATTKSDVRGINDLDLTKPGTFLFDSASMKTCETVNIDCLSMLKRQGLLDAVQTMTVTGEGGPQTTKGSYRDILTQMMDLSIAQATADLKDKVVLGVTLDKHDNMSMTVNPDAILDQWSWWSRYGLGKRPPVLDDITITYTVNMVESINPVSNHMDTIDYLVSGEVGKTKMFDLANNTRGEISIGLPIKEFNPSRSVLKDLSLKDFKPSVSVPEKSEELKRIEAKVPANRTQYESARWQTLKNQYEKDVAAAKEKITAEKQKEFEKRSNTNAGVLSLMIDALKSK